MNDLPLLLRSYGVEFASFGEHHHARPDWLAIRSCPFCGSERYHLGYSISRGFFNCWNCGGHGAISTLVRLGVPYPAASAFFRGRELPGDRQKPEARGTLREPGGREGLLPAHREYLRTRGLSPRDCAAIWELEGIGRLGGRLAWRLYIPITFRGRRVSWTSRAIGRHPLRYISASAEQEAINHRHVIYGLDHCLSSIILVEGPADAWKVGPGAGALFGLDYSPAQVLLASAFPRRIICFDSTPAAQRRAAQLADELASFPGQTTRVELDAADPGSASPKEIRALRRMAGMI